MGKALQALAKRWASQPGVLKPLADFVELFEAELSACPRTLEAAWLAWELCAADAGPKESVRLRLARCGAAQGVFCPGAAAEHGEALLAAARKRAPRPAEAQRLAPKFYMPGDPRPSNRRVELEKLRRRKKRMEKRLGAELAEAGREAHRAAALKAERERHTAQRRTNRLENEMQQLKKVIERENTGGTLAPRPARRKA